MCSACLDWLNSQNRGLSSAHPAKPAGKPPTRRSKKHTKQPAAKDTHIDEGLLEVPMEVGMHVACTDFASGLVELTVTRPTYFGRLAYHDLAVTLTAKDLTPYILV